MYPHDSPSVTPHSEISYIAVHFSFLLILFFFPLEWVTELLDNSFVSLSSLSFCVIWSCCYKPWLVLTAATWWRLTQLSLVTQKSVCSTFSNSLPFFSPFIFSAFVFPLSLCMHIGVDCWYLWIGKTCSILSFVNQTAVIEYSPSSVESYTVRLTADSHSYSCVIHDTAG